MFDAPVGRMKIGSYARPLHLIPLTHPMVLQRKHALRLDFLCDLPRMGVLLTVKRCLLWHKVQSERLNLAHSFYIDIELHRHRVKGSCFHSPT